MALLISAGDQKAKRLIMYISYKPVPWAEIRKKKKKKKGGPSKTTLRGRTFINMNYEHL